jgi:hypothetical protein
MVEWKRCRVGLDYHVEIAKHYCSVPHPLIRQEVEARITTTTVDEHRSGQVSPQSTGGRAGPRPAPPMSRS